MQHRSLGEAAARPEVRPGLEGAAAGLELEGSDFRKDKGIILGVFSRRNAALGTHSSLLASTV